MAHTFFRVKLIPVSIAYASDSMKSIQKIIIPFRMLYDHTKCVFHDNPGVVNCVPEFSALQLLICFVETVSQLFNVIRIVLAAMARSVKSGGVVSVPPVTLPVITFTVVTIKFEAVMTVTYRVPAEAIEAVHIKAVTVEPPFVSTGAFIAVGIEALPVIAVSVKTETIETLTVVPCRVVSLAIQAVAVITSAAVSFPVIPLGVVPVFVIFGLVQVSIRVPIPTGSPAIPAAPPRTPAIVLTFTLIIYLSSLRLLCCIRQLIVV